MIGNYRTPIAIRVRLWGAAASCLLTVSGCAAPLTRAEMGEPLPLEPTPTAQPAPSIAESKQATTTVGSGHRPHSGAVAGRSSATARPSKQTAARIAAKSGKKQGEHAASALPACRMPHPAAPQLASSNRVHLESSGSDSAVAKVSFVGQQATVGDESVANETDRRLRDELAPEPIAPGNERENVLPPPAAAPPRPPAPPSVARLNNQPVVGNWTLDQLTELALRNNPVMRRAQARIEAARGLAWQAGRWTNPRWDTNNPQILGVGRQNQYNAGFQMEIPVKGKKRLDRSAAERLVREAQLAAASDRYDVLQAVRQQFYSVVAQEQRIEVLERLVTIARNAHEASARLFEATTVAKTDVLLLLVEFRRAEAEQQQARALLVGKQRQLAASVGIPDLPIGDLVGDLEGRLPRFDDAFVRNFVATRNVDVLNAQTELARQRILLQRAEVEPYPNIYQGPAAAWSPNPSTVSTQFWYNFQFNIPVWDLNQGNIRAVRANIRDASANIRVTQNRLLFQAADALSRHRAAVELAERIRRDILPAAQQNQEIVYAAYRGGIGEVARLFQSQRALFEARTTYIDSLENVWTTAAELSNLLQIERFP